MVMLPATPSIWLLTRLPALPPDVSPPPPLTLPPAADASAVPRGPSGAGVLTAEVSVAPPLQRQTRPRCRRFCSPSVTEAAVDQFRDGG